MCIRSEVYSPLIFTSTHPSPLTKLTPHPPSQGHGGQGAESRSERQRRELQRKLEKNKSRLEQKKDHYQETQASYLQDLGSTTSEKAQQRLGVALSLSVVSVYLTSV